jgi:hypothetical protein
MDFNLRLFFSLIVLFFLLSCHDSLKRSLGSPQSFQIPGQDFDLRANVRSSQLILNGSIIGLDSLTTQIMPSGKLLKNIVVESMDPISAHELMILVFKDYFDIFDQVKHCSNQERSDLKNINKWDYCLVRNDKEQVQLSSSINNQYLFFQYQTVRDYFLFVRLWKNGDEIVGLVSYQHDLMKNKIHLFFSYRLDIPDYYILDFNDKDNQKIVQTCQGDDEQSCLEIKRYSPLERNLFLDDLDRMNSLKNGFSLIITIKDLFEYY